MDAVGDFGSQISHGDGVLEGAWSYLAQVAQQSLVGIRKFKQCDIRDKSEQLFYQIHQWIGKQ